MPVSNTLFFSCLEDVPESVWEDLSDRPAYLGRAYLNALQRQHPKISLNYIVVKNSHHKAIALATIQIVDFYTAALKSDYQNIAEHIKKIGKKLHLLKSKEKLSILICGNPFISGEHGIYQNAEENKQQIVAKIAKEISTLVITEKRFNKSVDFFLFKDFFNQSNELYSITAALKKYNYSPFSVEPNMRLDLRKNWTSFEDYLANFKTKFRVKAKRALALSECLKVVKVTIENFTTYQDGITKLYQSVAKNSSFNLVNFNPQTYEDFLNIFGKNYILNVYFLENKMVGFISGLINDTALDAHFVGIDYDYNKSYAIYQRILYDYVNLGIQRKLKTINFGRTASEIKSSIGAIPENLTMYVRHKKTIPNRLLKLFLSSIEPTAFQQKKPFKQL